MRSAHPMSYPYNVVRLKMMQEPTVLVNIS